MTVGELIKSLGDFDPELEVFGPNGGDGGGIDNLDIVESVYCRHTGWGNRYTGNYESVDKDHPDAIEGVYIA